MGYYIKGKGWFSDSGDKIGSRRQMDLMKANTYGKENDTASFTRLYCESRVSRELLNEAFMRGRKAMEAKQ